jgi:hypothetical protein
MTCSGVPTLPDRLSGHAARDSRDRRGLLLAAAQLLYSRLLRCTGDVAVGSISAANFFERGGGSCFNTGRQGTKLLIFTVAYLRLINW